MAVKIAGGSFGSQSAVKKALGKDGGGGGGLTWRVPVDGSIQVRFLTEPDAWFYYWERYDEATKAFFPLEEGEDRKGASLKVLANVVLRGTDRDDRVVPLKLAKGLAARVNNRFERSGTVMDRDFTLSRTGKGKNDTVYDCDAEPIDKQNLGKWDLFDLNDVAVKEFEAAMAEGGEDETGVDTDIEDEVETEVEEDEVEAEVEEDDDDEAEDEEGGDDEVEYETLQAMSIVDLKAWAKDLGAVVPAGCKKSDLVDLVWEAMD